MITYQIEPISKLIEDGIGNMASSHYEEVRTPSDFSQFDPDWEEYNRLEETDMLRFISVRDEGKLIGYSSIIVIKNPHCKGTYNAIIQDLYVIPERRKSMISFKLMRFVLSIISMLNVKQTMIFEPRTTSIKDIGRFYKYFGFNESETVWLKGD